MVLLILESLGSTELFFILVMALVFFGPRKLPQISRSLGKNLAEFRRASEEFKRTWDREVTLEEGLGNHDSPVPAQGSILNPENPVDGLPGPNIAPALPDQVIARQSSGSGTLHSSGSRDSLPDRIDLESVTDEPKHSPKNDWL